MDEQQLFATLSSELASYLRPFDAKSLRKAYDFAAKAHAGQKRKSGEPYIIHPLSAAIILAKMRVDMLTIITCLLHDVPEDTEYTLKDIEENFGKQVKELVSGITKLSAIYYKNDMRDRQIDTLRRMFLVMAKDIRVVLVKLADRLHNMRTLEHVKTEKSFRIAKETMEIFSPLANLLGVWEIRQEMDDLCFKYVYEKEYENIKKIVEANRSKHRNYLQKVKSTSRRLLLKENINGKMEARWKHLFSIYRKMQRMHTVAPELYDIPAIRIVVDSIPECYRTLGVIHGKWKPKPNQFKDYIAVSKPNGYSSLHTTVFGPDGSLVEFQIRTKEMDLEAKYGVASSFIYERSGGTADINSFLEKTPWVKKILKLQSKKNVKFIEDLKMNVLSDRVFVFSPDGDIIDMPKGSSPLDFAYTISPSLGNHYNFAYINKEKKPISYELSTGDIVEIVTSRNASPQREWLYFTITDEAKEAMGKSFKKLPSGERLDIGGTILDNVFALVQRGSFRGRSEREKQKIAEFFGYRSVKAFVLDVGSGEKTEKELTDMILKNRTIFSPKDQFFLHRILNLLFGQNMDLTIRMRLKLVLRDRIGLLSDIFEVLAYHRINIKRLVAREKLFSKGKAAIDYIDLEFVEPSQMHRAIRSLESIDGVVKVDQNKVLQSAAFYATITLCIAVWIIHPIFISALTSGNAMNRTLNVAVFWGTTLFLIAFMFYFKKFAKPYAPKAAGRRRFEIFFDLTILLVLGTLFIEVLSLHIINVFVFIPLMILSLIFGFWWSSR